MGAAVSGALHFTGTSRRTQRGPRERRTDTYPDAGPQLALALRERARGSTFCLVSSCFETTMTSR
jgi:hypothetical protein